MQQLVRETRGDPLIRDPHHPPSRGNLLPLDVTSGPNKNFVAIVNPIIQGECLVRVGLTGNMLGPNGLNNCAP